MIKTLVHSSLFIAVLIAAGVCFADTRRGLIAYWRLDEGAGAVAYDCSGNGYHGTIYNSPTSVAGKLNKALNFNGSSNYILTPSLGSPPQSVSLAAWIYAGAAGGVVFSEIGQAAINSGWHDSQVEVETDGTVKVCIWTGGLSCVNATASLGFNQWHHVALIYDAVSGTLTGYYDGVAGGSSSLAKLYPGTLYYAIGAIDSTSPGNGVYFNGYIDDVRIYNRALPAADVVQLYTIGAVRLNNFKGNKMRVNF